MTLKYAFRTHSVRVIFLLLITLLCISSTKVQAHLFGGTYEVSKEGYFIDIGYQPEFPQAGSIIRFDFSIFDESEPNSEIFSSVWVRITKKATEQVVFSGSLHEPRFGPAAMGLYIDNPGTYVVYARFEDGLNIVTEVDFEIEVEKGAASEQEQYSYTHFYVSALVVLLCGLFAFVLWRWRYRIR